MAASERGKLLWKLADLMEQHSDYLEELEALDNGKPMGRKGQYGSKVSGRLTRCRIQYSLQSNLMCCAYLSCTRLTSR